MAREHSSTAQGSHTGPEPSRIWPVVDRLLERLDADALRAHALVPLAAERIRSRGEDVPQELLKEERAAKMANLIAPSVLDRARDAYEGPMLVLKGPEVSALYPGRARMLVDLDLLVADAPAAWKSLLAVGFEPADRLERVLPSFYHLNPIELPGFPLPIELHKSAKWPAGLRPPPNEVLFEAAVPASVEVEGLLTPAPAHHTLLLAGHAWAERPLERFRDLIDVALMADGIDLARARANCGRMAVGSDVAGHESHDRMAGGGCAATRPTSAVGKASRRVSRADGSRAATSPVAVSFLGASPSIRGPRDRV